MRVKKAGGGVWSRRANLSSGSKDMSAECGLGGELAERVKGHVGGVWSRRANLSRGSRRLSAECGLGGRTCFAGQRTCRRSVV